MAKWICQTCVYDPPSACDGKPCCMCDPNDPMLNCYQWKEDAGNIQTEVERYAQNKSTSCSNDAGVRTEGEESGDR